MALQSPATKQILEQVKIAGAGGGATPGAAGGTPEPGQPLEPQHELYQPAADKPRVPESTDPNWKPDFTKQNPYEGMPSWYADKVKQGYVPTVDRPLNPVQEAALRGEVSQKYLPELVDVGINTDNPTKIPKVYYEQARRESPNMADLLKTKGVEAYRNETGRELFFRGAEGVERDVKYLPAYEQERLREAYNKSKESGDLSEYNALVKELNDKYETEEKEFREKLQSEDPYLFEIYEREGIEGYNRAVTKRAADLDNVYREFEKTHTQLPDGQWVENKFLVDLQKDYPYAYEVLTTRGYDAYDTEYNKALAAIEPFTDKDGKIMLPVAAYVLPKEDLKNLELIFDKKTLKEMAERANAKEAAEIARTSQEYLKSGPLSRSLSQQIKDELRAMGFTIKSYPVVAPLIEYDIQKSREQLKEKVKNFPAPVRYAAEFGTRTAGGALVMAPYMMGGMALTIASIPYAKNKAGYIKGIGTGIWDYFKQIPGNVKRDPAMFGELVGTFVIGPGGAAKLLKGKIVQADPYYLSNQGLRYSFSTGKIMLKKGDVGAFIKSGKITDIQVNGAVTRATNRFISNPSEAAKARIGNSGIVVKIEPTPASKRLGAALWHSTTEKEPYTGKTLTVEAGAGKEPALFTSVHAAPRFAIMSASGEAATNPALVMLYTKEGLKTYPVSIGKSANLAEMQAKVFDYFRSGKAEGIYGPAKEYGGGKIELEAMASPTTTIYRVKNLRSRLLGEKAGEFVTVVDGWVMPIFRFAEKGAEVPKVSLSTLAALRVESVIHSLRLITKSDIGKGRTGFGAEAGYATVNTLARQFEAAGRTAARSIRPGVNSYAYNTAVNRAMRERLERALRDYPAAVREYERNPGIYERAYLERLDRNLAEVYRTSPARGFERGLPGRETPDRALRDPGIQYSAPAPRTLPRGTPERAIPERGIPERGTPERGIPERSIPARDITRVPPGERITRVPPGEGTPPRMPSSGASDSEKREFLKKVPGLVAYRRGELNGEDVWHVFHYPYGENDRLILLGRPPKGAVSYSGPGSTNKTARVLRGLPPSEPIFENTGAVDDVLTTEGQRLRVQSISEHSRGPLTEKASLPRRGRGFRVSPRVKRLPR